MNQIVDTLIHFLGVVSLQIFILCVIAELFMRILRVRHYSAYWVYGFIMLSPILSAVSFSLPCRFDISIPVYRTQQNVSSPVTQQVFFHSSIKTVVNETGMELNKGNNTKPSLLLPERKTCLIGGWILIAIGLTVYQINRLRLLLKAMLVLTPTDDPRLIRVFADCAKTIGLKRLPRLILSDAADSPLVFGVITPSIIIPLRYRNEPESEDLRFALLHELVHVKHGDHWMWLPEFLLRHLFFFHPCVYWISRKIREEMELRCDRKVVELSHKKMEYAEFLLREIWMVSGNNENQFALPILSGQKRTERRVRRIFTLRSITMKEKLRNQCLALITIVSLIALLFVSINFNITTKALADNQEKSTGASGGSGGISDEKDISGLQRIMENGKPVIPWAWKLEDNYKSGSVMVDIGKRIGKEGVDFFVDEKKKILSFLKAADCLDLAGYEISYSLNGHSYFNVDPQEQFIEEPFVKVKSIPFGPNQISNTAGAAGSGSISSGKTPSRRSIHRSYSIPELNDNLVFLAKENDLSVFLLSPVYESVIGIIIENSVYTDKKDWVFDPAKNCLSIKSSIIKDAYNTLIKGKRVIPWKWIVPEGIDINSVAVLIGGRLGIKGVEYDINEKDRIVTFLKPELCTSEQKYLIYAPDPNHIMPEEGFVFGNIVMDDKELQKMIQAKQ